MTHIVLIGFMGSGKSTLASTLSLTFTLPIFSTDAVIENLNQMRIAKIFEIYGECFFRSQESKIFAQIQKLSKPHIIDCGGGFGIYQDVNSLGEVVFLDVEFDVIYSRLSILKNHNRPLFDHNVKKLFYSRLEIYRAKADVILKTDQEVLEWITSNQRA